MVRSYRKGLLIYSGGMDSTVMLYHLKRNVGICVSFNYGSKHNHRELEFAKLNAKKLEKEHIIIDLQEPVNTYFKSDLLKSGKGIPEGHYEDETMRSTVVPFRNGIMLSFATGIAESRGLEAVYIANHAGDHAIYPDCRSTFIDSMNNAMYYGTYNNIRLNAPFTHFTKREIGLLGKEEGVDFNLTWSCYKGGEVHCGKCGTCVERKEALEGFDKTTYEGEV